MRLSEFYDMPYCEFLIKSFAYNRMQKERMRHSRLVAYSALIGSHYDPKKLPKNEEAFLPIDQKRREKNKDIIDLFNRRKKEWELEQLKKKDK